MINQTLNSFVSIILASCRDLTLNRAFGVFNRAGQGQRPLRSKQTSEGSLTVVEDEGNRS
jgi:hypothetical protein